MHARIPIALFAALVLTLGTTWAHAAPSVIIDKSPVEPTADGAVTAAGVRASGCALGSGAGVVRAEIKLSIFK